jgi:hypothetical protein
MIHTSNYPKFMMGRLHVEKVWSLAEFNGDKGREKFEF